MLLLVQLNNAIFGLLLSPCSAADVMVRLHSLLTFHHAELIPVDKVDFVARKRCDERTMLENVNRANKQSTTTARDRDQRASSNQCPVYYQQPITILIISVRSSLAKDNYISIAVQPCSVLWRMTNSIRLQCRSLASLSVCLSGLIAGRRGRRLSTQPSLPLWVTDVWL